MGKPCWFPFYAGDFLASSKVALMEPAEIGAYVILLCYQWQSDDCSLPNDDEKLRKLSRFSGDLTLIKSCFWEKKDKIYNDRLFHEWVKVKQIKDLGSRSGKQGADKRWPKRVTGSCSNPVTGSGQGSMKNLTGNEHSSQSQSQSQSQSEEDKEEDIPAAVPPCVPRNAELLTVEWVVEKWNGTGMRKCLKANGPIRDRIKTRIREHPDQAWFCDLFARCQSSMFLSGRSEVGFVASLDWVLGPKNLAKIEAGNYDNRDSPPPPLPMAYEGSYHKKVCL